jgi:hypothetical protein
MAEFASEINREIKIGDNMYVSKELLIISLNT